MVESTRGILLIIEYCKECGGKIEHRVKCCIPPIYERKCSRCARVVSSDQGMIEYKEV